MDSQEQNFSIGNTISKDGTNISYRIIGKGIPLVIVPGTARLAKHYDELARSLADSFTVYVTDRRGHGNSGPQGIDYSLEKEQEDIFAVLKKTEATLLFGHSYGGLVALEAALKYPLEKLALYEPSVSLNGSLQVKWLPSFEEAILQENFIQAEKIFLRGMGVDIPDELLETYIQSMCQSSEWEETVRLMPTIANECKEACRVDSTFSKYKEIAAETLIMAGTEGSADDILFNKMAADALETAILNWKKITLQGCDHNAPDMHSPEQVAQVLKDFFIK